MAISTIDQTGLNAPLTLTAPVISTITNGAATLTLPSSTGTLALTSSLPASSQLPKAWVNFGYSGSITVNKSYNVSSVTRTGTGQYTITITTALADTSYAMVAGGTFSTTTGQGYNYYNVWANCLPSTTTVCYIYFVGGSFYDAANCSLVIFD
jgi:hypothetical protein